MRRTQEREGVQVTELELEKTIRTELKYKLESANMPRFNRIRRILAALDHPKTCLELAQDIRVFPSNMHRTLNALEHAGWVARVGTVHVGHNRPASLWRRCARLVFEDEFLTPATPDMYHGKS